MKKLKLTDHSQLPNPCDLFWWKNEVPLLQDISCPDIYSYLINHPSSVFTNESRPTNPSIHTIVSSWVMSRKYTIMKLKKIVNSASSNQR